jgi:large conductance mechanosensitive channel
MSWLKQFRDFAIKGNVIELSVAVVIGAAFSGIVSSLVEDVITPLILTPATNAAGVADIDKLAWGTIKYGKSLAAIIKFVLIAFVLFLVIQAVNKIKHAENEKAEKPPLTTSEKLLTEIRDHLNAKDEANRL